MNRATAFFLILLRLAIGWQLLFAGLEKFQPSYPGSEGYLRQSTGPLAPYFHWLVGTPVLDRFAVVPAQGNPAADKAKDRLPPPLKAEWEDYFNRFVSHYGIEGKQREEVRGALDQYEADTVNWMETGKETVRLKSPTGEDVPVETTVASRVEEYRKLLEKANRLSDEQVQFTFQEWLGNSPPTNPELTQAQQEVLALRKELTSDLRSRTQEMKDRLRAKLTPEQASKAPMEDQAPVGWKEMRRLDWVDFAVRWGLVILGACLLVGLFSRSASLVGALLVLSFYLAMPPLPGVPEFVRSEGYPFINKNLIEVLALLVLATTASGRWLGLDGLIRSFRLWRRGSPETTRAPATQEASATESVGAGSVSNGPPAEPEA
jgi:uncharacterized membrane protein YphA (DoxX/SURF4 family)